MKDEWQENMKVEAIQIHKTISSTNVLEWLLIILNYSVKKAQGEVMGHCCKTEAARESRFMHIWSAELAEGIKCKDGFFSPPWIYNTE